MSLSGVVSSGEGGMTSSKECAIPDLPTRDILVLYLMLCFVSQCLTSSVNICPTFCFEV